MGLNWVEDLVAHLYQIRGYMVIQDLDLPMPKTESRSVRGHSDVDVLAINETEIIHIECQSWWGPDRASESKELHQLKARFDHAPETIRARFPFLKLESKFLNVFVTSGKPKKGQGKGPWSRLQDFCAKECIDLREINMVIRDLIVELRKKYPRPDRVGKEPPLARFLLHLIHNNFLSENTEQPLHRYNLPADGQVDGERRR